MEVLVHTLDSLTPDDLGAPTADILAVLDHLRDAGYDVGVFTLPDRRVYRATDPETGEHQQVSTVPGAVTDWRAVTGVACLWGLSFKGNA